MHKSILGALNKKQNLRQFSQDSHFEQMQAHVDEGGKITDSQRDELKKHQGN